MRLNWFSNAPWSPTGYGNQTRLFAPRLQKMGHNVSITAFYGHDGMPIQSGGMTIYGKAHHLYGQDIISAHATFDRADAIISLLDIWVCQPDRITFPWFPWFPIDHEPIPGNVLGAARAATKPIVMSKFGQKMAERAELETMYVPHGVETDVFKPEDMRKCRKEIGLPEDAFVVGMVAANKGNPPRKAFYEQLAAFSALRKAHPDAVLYMHTDDGTHGGEVVDLIQYCRRIGLEPGRDIFFCDQYVYSIGFSDAYMRMAYNAMDVFMNVSLGEGFGIPILEAQACGTPVIVGDWTSMSELCFSGWKIAKHEATPIYHGFFDAFQFTASPEAIADRLFAAYEMRGNQDYRRIARAAALRYDADKVAEKYWKPALVEMQSIIDEMKIPALAKVEA